MPTRIFHRAAARVRRRFDRDRRGSVMILVIALLVLMALIGTAFITTARTDRLSATTHTYNTQVDLLVQGVIDLSQEQIIKAVYQNPGTGLTFRPETYINVEHPGENVYLADRYPINPSSVGGTVNQICWQYISASPLATPSTWTSQQYETPLGQPWGQAALSTSPKILRQWPTNAPNAYVPTSTTINYGNNLIRRYPAIQVIPGSGTTGTAGTYLAADADGDGIADAGLFRLPIGTVNGVTYYGAIRVIDNGAAINASVAMKPLETSDNFTLVQSSGPYAGSFNYFPTNIDLRSAVNTVDPQGFYNLMYYRISGSVPAVSGLAINTSYQAQWPAEDNPNPPGPAGVTPAVNKWEYTSAYEAQWVGLGARLNFPGYSSFGNGSGGYLRWNALTTGDATSMAYRFCLTNTEGTDSTLDRAFPNAMKSPAVKRTAYQPNDTGNWFNNIFNYSTTVPTSHPLRPLVVARNPVSAFIPNRAVPNGSNFGDWKYSADGAYVSLMDGNGLPTSDPTGWAHVSWANHPTRASVNTAGFGELWVAYWQVMKRLPTGVGPDADGNTDNRQFRTPGTMSKPAAGGGGYKVLLPPQEVRKLRSALAAVNTMDYRDPDDNPSVRTITVKDTANTPYTIKIAGCEIQPFITEAFVHLFSVDDANMRDAFVAIELFNPSSVPVTLSNFRLATFTRDPNAPAGSFSTLGGALPASIGPGARVVLMSSTDPKDWPDDTTTKTKLAAIAGPTAMPSLKNVLSVGNRELVLIRNVDEGIPVDAVGFEGIYSPRDDGQKEEHRFHYARATSGADKWQCAYAYGDTGANKFRNIFSPTQTAGKTGDQRLVYRGWQYDQNYDAAKKMLVNPAPGNLGEAKNAGSGGSLANQATFVGRPVPLRNNKCLQNDPTTPPGHFPFGGFKREGDVLEVPFIGNYLIKTAGMAGGTFVDFNPVTVDAVMAEDGDEDPNENKYECIGRFCPMDNPANPGNDDFKPAPVNSAPNTVLPEWRYQFAFDLFDFLTVRTPQSDYFPNVFPGTGAAPENTGSGWNVAPIPVPNGPVTDVNQANRGNEDAVGEDGKININTANWRVLAALPMVVNPATGTLDYPNNAALARAIVAYRDYNDGTGKPHGPFKNLFELQKVPGFKLMQGAVAQGTLDAADPQGLRFQANYMALTNISNLVSFRSDSFTVYVVVQGWRNVGTATPEMVVQRRAAFICDRSTVRPINGQAGVARTSMSVLNVPNN